MISIRMHRVGDDYSIFVAPNWLIKLN